MHERTWREENEFSTGGNIKERQCYHLNSSLSHFHMHYWPFYAMYVNVVSNVKAVSRRLKRLG